MAFRVVTRKLGSGLTNGLFYFISAFTCYKLQYDYYSFSVIPAVGELVVGDHGSYQYLVESARCFPPQEKYAAMVSDAGFQKDVYENLVGGIVAILSGLKVLEGVNMNEISNHD